MTNLWRNLQFGFRLLRKNPGFAFISILALALGIGANTAIFSVVYGTLLAPLPYPQPERLVSVWSKVRGQTEYASPADFLDWKRKNTVFECLCAMARGRMTLSDATGAESVRLWRSTPDCGDSLGMPLLFGRGFLPEEGEPGKDHVAVLSFILWRDRYGSDRNILGRKIRLDKEAYTVVGVSGPPVTDREISRLTLPLAFKSELINHDDHWLLVQGRLKPGVTLAQANAAMETVASQIAAANPKSNKDWGVVVQSRKNEFASLELRRSLWLLMGAVIFVLLIACANVANLMLARGTARQKEIAVRRSMGATRGQLVAQFLTESVMLAFVGATLGLGLAWGLLKIILVLMPPYTLPTEAEIRLQWPVLLFTLVVTTVSAVLFGSAPALQSLRVNLSETLKEGTRSSVGVGHRGLRRSLVVAEFALALTLLAGAGLAIHGLWKAAHVNLGFRTDHILTFWLPTPPDGIAHPEQVKAFYNVLLPRIEALPGVSSASVSNTGPGSVGARLAFNFVGKPTDASSRPQTGFGAVTPGYFQTFGIRVLRGRALTDQDIEGGVRVAVVNQAFVTRYLSGVDPLVQSVAVPQIVFGSRNPGPTVEWQIVGVYADTRNAGLGEDPFPEMNVPFAQNPWPFAETAVRTVSDPEQIRKSIAAVVQSIDPDLPMVGVQTMDDAVSDSWAGERFGAALFGSFGAVGLILAAFGIYGVMAFAVAQRTREIGLRLALGAGRNQILRLFVGEGIVLGFIGLGVGIGGVYTVGRLMRGMWYGTSTGDPILFTAVAGVLLAAAVLACYIPARRAAKVDPMVALRYE